MRKIILASKSPRRRELLAALGYQFEPAEARCEEVITRTAPQEVVEELSRQKALDVYQLYMENNGNTKDEESFVVIGADTVVSIAGRILGKPKSGREAFEMLKLLQGRTHEVYTGVTLAWGVPEVHLHSFHECTEVTFYPMEDVEIWDYVNTGDSMDKAGAYGIQSGAAKFIRAINGDYNNVVGLPIARLYHELRNADSNLTLRGNEDGVGI